MAALSGLLLWAIIASLVFMPAWALLSDWDQMTSSAPLEPHFTDCVSRDQETFRCWWSPGIFQNLSSPGDLKVFYLKQESLTSEWKECPEYIHANRECFFDRNHTSIWVTYCVQLRNQNVTYFNEDDCFSVENIVRPDPPVSLNWTLLNVSPSGLSYDVVINWEPPPSADVRVGWMRIDYEIQYREKNTTNWEALEVQPHTKQTIYGLHVGKEYEVHIRCKMQIFTKFGEFSDSIFIQVTEIDTDEPPVLFILVLVLGIVGVLILIMLIAVSQQHRLMMILLPPVPAPKIKGVDSELLKKGKLDDLNFFLTGGGFGGIAPYAPEFYQDEPWVDFIEVDVEDKESRDKEDSLASDTQMLLNLNHSGCQHTNLGCSSSVSSPDSSSGQASHCYDPAILGPNSLILMATLLPGQPEEEEEASFKEIQRCSISENGDKQPVDDQNSGHPTWMNTDFYAQVSNVMPSGGVVLSPGQHVRIPESSSLTEEGTPKNESRDVHETEEKKQKELHTQLLVVNPEENEFTSENSSSPTSTPCSPPATREEYQTVEPLPAQTNAVSVSQSNQSPYILPDSPECNYFSPVSDYTVVQELDNHHSLLLQPPPQQPLPSCLPLKVPLPIGYITPDLLGDLSS